MTYRGRDPERETRRAGEPPSDARRASFGSSAGPSGTHAAGSESGDFVLGADGQPLRDRYGRPVRRRPQSASGNRHGSQGHHAPAHRGNLSAARPEETRFDVDAYMAQHTPRQSAPRQQPVQHSGQLSLIHI